MILWAAGVRASPAAAWLGVPADGAGRIKVAADLTAPGPARDFRHRRHRHHRCLAWQAGARHRAGRQTARHARRRHHQAPARRRCLAAAVSLPARRQSRHHRQALGGHRLRLDQGPRLHRLVDLGARPHLFLDRRAQPLGGRAQLAVDLPHRDPQRLPHHPGRAASASPQSPRQRLKKMPEFRSALCRG